jgi:DNA-binding HxlR family transcriptional regulator
MLSLSSLANPRDDIPIFRPYVKPSFQDTNLSSRYTCVPSCATHKRLAKYRCSSGIKTELAAILARFCRNQTQRLPKGDRLLFIGRWTVKVLYALKDRPRRHGELRRHVGSVSQRMLTKTLRNLESSGLVERRVTTAKSIAVQYSLSKAGKAFLVPLGSVCRWANRHQRELNAVVGPLGAQKRKT